MSDSRRVKSKPDTLPEQQQITLSVNTLIDGKFIQAGDPLPVSSDNLPESLKPFVVTDDEPEPDDESNARFELNTVYAMNSEGRRGRALNRQVAQLEAEAEQQAWAEEQLFSPPLAPEIAEALQAANEESVGRQMAEAEVRARWLDSATEAAERGGE